MKRDDDATTRARSPADGPPGPLVVRLVGPSLFATHTLPASGRVVLGRSNEADIVVPDASVSRRHAVLHVGPTLRIEDLGSANGTRVRAKSLGEGEPADLAVGEAAELGSITVVVHRSPARARAEKPTSFESPNEGPMRAVYELVSRVAPAMINVLVLGETGAGKEVIAQAVHAASPRKDKPLVIVNCAAFTEQLLESELFGHEKGAFTGAHGTKVGLLESAEGGTVFFDEIGELPLSLQPKLLRVIEERKVRRLGSVNARPIDVRFVAATNRSLDEEVEARRFRQDLYFRLAGVTIAVPPLRERVSEIAGLARLFIARVTPPSVPVPVLSVSALAFLESHAWPGNVRELKNFIERAVLLSGGGTIASEHFPLARTSLAPQSAPMVEPPPASDAEGLKRALDDLERRRVTDALLACAGNQSQAAKVLGISRNTLLARIAEYGLPRPRKK